MSRKSIVCLFAVLLLAGCGRSPLGTGYAVTYPEQLRDSNAQTFSYTHFLRLVMAHDSVKPRFERARDLCLRDAALGCKLIAAAISVNDNAYVTGDQASLAVALPHDKVAVFEKALLEPLPQDGSDKVSVQSRTTSAENVTTEASDTDRKITQLTAYRDKLAVLAKRSDLSVADLMKVEAELSKVEGDLDAALSDKRDVGRTHRQRTADGFIGRETGPLRAHRAGLAQCGRYIRREHRERNRFFDPRHSMAADRRRRSVPGFALLAVVPPQESGRIT
jgi:hypothetical protein